MIAFSIEALRNDEIQHEARQAYSFGLITRDEMDSIKKTYPVIFFSPNFFISIGLFVLTVIIVLFSVGLIVLVTDNNFGHEFSTILIFCSLAIYAVLEYFVQKKKHYHSGVDAALLWSSGALMLAGWNGLYDIRPQANCAIILLLSIYFIIRFIDSAMVLVSASAFFSLLFFTCIRYGEIGRLLFPFVSMATAALFYFYSQYYLSQAGHRYYRSCMVVLSIIGLIAFYMSVNYFVVREISIKGFGLRLSPGHSLPWRSFFWSCTVLVPILYILCGVSRKDRTPLRVGLLLLAVSVISVRYYYTIMPLDYMMLLGGGILLMGAYILTRYLKIPRRGFTSLPANDAEVDGMNVEGLIISETMSAAQPVPETRFGGGSFGGGGASGEF